MTLTKDEFEATKRGDQVESIPSFLNHLQHYRGYPVSFITHVRADGTPDFKVTDHTKWQLVVFGNLCAICGKTLRYWKYFIGGPTCCETRIFYDPAMHLECAEYSLRTCPFLSNSDSKYASTYKLDPGVEVATLPMSGKRPPKIGLYRTRGYRVVRIEDSKGEYGSLVIHADPAQEITYYP